MLSRIANHNGRIRRAFIVALMMGFLCALKIEQASPVFAWNSTLLTILDGYGTTLNHKTIFDQAISDISQVKHSDGTPAYPDIVNQYKSTLRAGADNEDAHKDGVVMVRLIHLAEIMRAYYLVPELRLLSLRATHRILWVPLQTGI